MADQPELIPVIGVRLGEGRSGSTLLMQLLATSNQITFDDRYPAEYRFLSYFARLSAMITEPFDHTRHPGVTPFFFDPTPRWGPIPFHSDVTDIAALADPSLTGLWAAWTSTTRTRHPHARFYAEKLAVDIDQIHRAHIPIRVIDLVRDPRDVLASIRAFTATGTDGFGRTPDMTDADHLEHFLATYSHGLRQMLTSPTGLDRIIVRYEDLATHLAVQAKRIGDWLGVELDAAQVETNRDDYRHHMTTNTVTESVGRWRHDLTPNEAQLISDTLRDLAKPFGYRL